MSPTRQFFRALHPAALALLAPPLALGVACGWIVLSAAAGTHPLWPDARITLSEAVALRDLGALVELLEAGHDPHATYPVAERLIRDQAMVLTPFEAVVESGREDVLQFLLQRGVAPTDVERRDLVCLAKDLSRTQIVAILDPAGAVVDCP